MTVQLPLKIGHKEEYFTIEPATTDHDLTRIATVVNTAYKKVKYLQSEVERATSAEILDFISNPNKKLYLCISPSHEICGTILLDFSDKNEAEIALFAIHLDYQGCKIGPMFMSYVEQEAFKKVQVIILKVIPLFQENLMRFYERSGYKATGEVMDFPAEGKLRYIRPDCRDRVFFCIMQKNRN
ncbi:MAG: GNAT family N-acetyltransferase [Chlamydiota bacterium]